MTKIIFDGVKTFLLTKDKVVIARLEMDFKGVRDDSGIVKFDLSNHNVLVITENRATMQGLYFQINTVQPTTDKKPAPIPAKKEPVISTIKPVEPHKTEKPTSIHFKPQEAKNNVVSRFKKGKPQISEEDIWNED